MWNEDSDIEGIAEVVAVARMYVSATAGIQARRKRLMWDAAAGLPMTQSFQGHVVHFLSIHFKVRSLFEMGRHALW